MSMVERLDDMPPGTLGFRASGEIEREDYDTVLVTDIEWMARATRLFLWMIPGEARVFPLSRLADAKAWVAGD